MKGLISHALQLVRVLDDEGMLQEPHGLPPWVGLDFAFVMFMPLVSSSPRPAKLPLRRLH
jgi:hypothetical protein